MTAKTVGDASMAVMLAGAGAAVLAAAPESAVAVPEKAAVAASEGAVAGVATAKTVEGSFLFTQEMSTPNDVIREVFTKASAVLCASLPTYGAVDAGAGVVVTGPDGSVLGTVDELAEGDGTTVMVGCACASNAAGGGAIANAGVSGTTLAALIAAVSA